jgi:CRP/FNR family transcriptional regulator, cyclic AMP receptor protein
LPAVTPVVTLSLTAYKRCPDDTGVVEWPILHVLDEVERRELLKLSRRRRFGRNEVIFHEGDAANSLHLVTSGHASVRVATPDGNSVTLAIVGPGETFGELALLGKDDRRAATVTAMEKCETLSLHKERFEALRNQHPRVDRLLAEILAEEIRRLDGRLLEFLYLPADKRVLRRLASLAGTYREDAQERVVVPLTQDVIAGLAGASRPTTNQALRAVEAAGIIAIGRARIEILDPVALVRRAR